MARQLYKYLDIEGGIKMLQNSNIQFTNPTKFNDPFDCHPSLIDYSKSPEDIEKKRSVEGVARFHYSYNWWGREFYWICCLSKVYDSLLMWSYYCKHEGICIGLDISKTKEDLSKLRGVPNGFPDEIEVQYKNIIEKPNIYQDMNKLYLQYQLGTKAEAWIHEQEVRLCMLGNCDNTYHMLDSLKKPSFPKIGGDCFYSLYLGVRIDEEKKKEVINIARKLNPCINIFQMKINTDSFKLDAVKME